MAHRSGLWRGRQRRSLPRWRESFLCTHLAYSPTRRDLEYLDAFRSSLRANRTPTLERLAVELGVRRQTIHQREGRPGFVAWLATEIRLWRLGFGWMDVNGDRQPPGVDFVGKLIARKHLR